MVAHNAISESEAIKVAGVSARTLSRFSDAGYLTLHVESDGQRYYLKDQLAEIFGAFQVETNTPLQTESPGAPVCEMTEERGSSVESCEAPASESYYSATDSSPLVACV